MLPIETACWFLKQADQRGTGIVAGHIRWRNEMMTLIEVNEDEFVVRPADLVVDRPDAPIGFSQVDEAVYAQIADLLVMGRA